MGKEKLISKIQRHAVKDSINNKQNTTIYMTPQDSSWTTNSHRCDDWYCWESIQCNIQNLKKRCEYRSDDWKDILGWKRVKVTSIEVLDYED